MQELLLLLAPSLFAASIYMVLSRIIRVSKGEERSPVPARWITRIFVVGDVVAILGQATGEVFPCFPLQIHFVVEQRTFVLICP